MKKHLVCGSGLIGAGLLGGSNFGQLENSLNKDLRYAHSCNEMQLHNILKAIAKEVPDSFINASGPSNVAESFQMPDVYEYEPVRQCMSHINILSNLDSPPAYVYISSGSVYGDTELDSVSENSVLAPLSPYAYGKLHAEEYLREIASEYPAPIVSLRVYSAYSKELRSRLPFLIASHLKSQKPLNLFGTGEEIRDFIHISDISRAIEVICILNNPSGFSVYNLGTGQGMSIRELCTLGMNVLRETKLNIKDLFSFSNEVRVGDPRIMVADLTKLKAQGFNPKVIPIDGMGKYFSWHLINP